MKRHIDLLETILKRKFPIDIQKIKDIDFDEDLNEINVKVKKGMFDVDKYKIELIITKL